MIRSGDAAAARTGRRLVGLDVLRLAAIVLVLGRHMPPPPDTWSPPWRVILLAWQRGGWVGVDLFFVLSGFLVSGLLFTEHKSRGRFSIGRFYVRRGFKIYPPFYTLIAVTVVGILMSREPLYGWPLASELFFFQSYVAGLWDHTWSLAVEEHFYLLLPLLLALVLKLNRRSPTPLAPVLGVSAGVAVLALLARAIAWRYGPPYTNLRNLFASHLRFDSLFFGVAISYAYHFHPVAFVERLFPWRRWLIAGGALLLVPPFVFPIETSPFMFTAGLTVFYVGSGMLMVGTLLIPDLHHRRVVVLLAALGADSYSIYLWHMPVRELGAPLVEVLSGATLGFAMRAAIYLLGSLAFGVLMARLIEVPALRLRDRWFPRQSPGPIEDRPAP